MQANYLTLNPSSQFYHPGYAAPGNRGSLLEVELSSTSFPLPRVPSDPDSGCPPTVRLTFPAGRHQGKDFPTTVVELGNASLVAGNNCVYNEVVDQIPLAICENRDHPCVHHPDQWDDLAISWGGVSSIPLDGIRVTNFAAGADAEEPGNLSYFNLVYTTNTDLETGLYQPPPPPDPPRPQHNYEAGTRKVLAPGSLSLTPSPVSLAAEIEERRRLVTEWIIWNAYNSNIAPSFLGATRDDVDLDALPRTVREGTYDHGQAGAYKYAGDWTYGGTIAACSGTQMFYQSNYAEDYQTDFVDLLGNPLHRYECSYDPVTLEHYCHNSPGFWPNPRGTLQVWRQFPPLPIDNRALAKAVFDPVTGALTGFFEVTNPFGGNQNTWARSANQYEPKPGDYFWRFDRCWHGSSNRHAMTLVADPYHAAGGTNLNAPIFDGSNFFMVRDRDFTGQATQSIPALCDPATTPSLQCDCDGDGTAESYDCAPPRHNPDGETGVQQRLVDLGGGVCACGGLNNERRCPPATNPDGTPAPRYDFYVAESRSARELFVYSQKHDTKPFDWSVISQGLITQPSFDQTQPHQRPAMEALSFGRIDNDVYDDIFWKTPQNTIWIALSSDDYGFWRAPGVGASFQMIEAVDFGQLQADGQSLNSASDGFTDLVALTGSGAQMSVIVSVNDSSSPFAFSSWLLVESFPSLGHDVAWWAERMRFADFDGDGVTDIMRAVDGDWEISFRTGAPNWSGDFGNVAFYQFADLDYDGRTDIVTRYNNAWWWSSYANGWSAWAPFNTDFQGCDVGEVKFVNWDGDAPAPGSVRADLLCLSPLGDWQVVLDHDPANVVQIHARSDSAANLAFGNFKTVGDATDNNELIDDVLYFGGSPIEHLF